MIKNPLEKKSTAPVKWIIVMAIFALSPFALVGIWIWSISGPSRGIAVEQVDWLPQEATNISYYKSYIFTAYEFDISEKGFKKWVSNFDQVRVIEKPTTIARYSLAKDHYIDGADESNWIPDTESSYIKISKGYYSGHTDMDGGGHHVGYDSIKGRAYRQYNPR
ncbi:MAG: hypothetical protein L3J39_06585 [Verrucomicrobiales bacterium]|nr:hypothetical protein [Verrucomicrobiales bacterium]